MFNMSDENRANTTSNDSSNPNCHGNALDATTTTITTTTTTTSSRLSNRTPRHSSDEDEDGTSMTATMTDDHSITTRLTLVDILHHYPPNHDHDLFYLLTPELLLDMELSHRHHVREPFDRRSLARILDEVIDLIDSPHANENETNHNDIRSSSWVTDHHFHTRNVRRRHHDPQQRDPTTQPPPPPTN
jgi:hypothetical protein